ncbi:MAG: FIST N-terminal domain-containing protein [Methanobacteriaceae archaeon]|jgi:hypothetical protein|nr:FIST N-terminal domain-containing protein [Methanobacteriaceae archaeon]MDO9626160.1 FIST N-terminal domain-containing protein [Methanobacteriaceae archaeon]
MKTGVGYSKSKDSAQAGIEAVENALKESGKPSLTFLFTTDVYDQKSVFESVKELVGDSKIVGFCGGGIITPEGVLRQGVGVCTLSGKELLVETSLQKNINLNPHKAGEKAGEKLMASGIQKGTVFAFPDGFTSNISETIQGLYNTMGPDFKYAGGGAGDNLKFFKTYQFTEKGVESRALATALIDGIEIQTSIGHGWEPKRDPMIITNSNGKKVVEINGITAFDSYNEQIGVIGTEKFPEYGMRYPLGFPDVSGNYLIRDPLKLNFDKSIDFVTEIPKNAVGNVMEGEIIDLIKTAKNVAEKAVQNIEKPQFVLLFDCISRYLLMGDEFEKELESIKKVIGFEVPFLGALTFGEVGSYIDVPLFHNKTVVIVVG